MSGIGGGAGLEVVAAAVSTALEGAGIVATLSGGSAVSIYTENAYVSRDLDFVTAAGVDELKPVLSELGFEHTGRPRLSQFEHPDVAWYLEFPPAPIAFGRLIVDPGDCARLRLPLGVLRIISPTQSVMDRLAAAFVWQDPQSREQAELVAAHQEVDWGALGKWFQGEGGSQAEFERFRAAAGRRASR